MDRKWREDAPYGLFRCEITADLIGKEDGPKGISAHIFDWLCRKRYKVLPEWHLGKGNEKEGLIAPRQTIFYL